MVRSVAAVSCEGLRTYTYSPVLEACQYKACSSLRSDTWLSITRPKVQKSRSARREPQRTRPLSTNGRGRAVCSLNSPSEDGTDSSPPPRPSSSDSFDSPLLKEGLATDPGPSVSGEPVRPPYGVITSLALAGAAETAYLTWTKLFGDGTVTCPLGGDCNDVLNSEYAVLFGLPLSMYGLVAYSAVALLSQLSRDGREHGHSYTRWLLLGMTSLMATASGFFLYLLAFKLDTPSCSYCFASAALSISLFLCTGWGFTTKELQRAALPQLALSMGTILAFSLAFSDVRSAQAGSGEIDLPPLEPEVLTVSTSREVALAKHLRAVGAKMYGAFWCSHCYEQKQMFGREAMKYVEYVECYPDGYRRGVQLDPACESAGIEGFPTWIVNGQVLPGERSLEELAQVSEFITK